MTISKPIDLGKFSSLSALSNDFKVEKNRQKWNDFAHEYSDSIQTFTVQASVVLYTMTSSNNADRILEVACGGGLPSCVFMQNYMKRGASYFCCDFSENMIAETRARINSSYIKRDPAFEHIETTFEKNCSVESAISPFNECEK